jgi:hypothetical protein
MDPERRAFLAHALQHLERGVIERIHRAFDIVMAPFTDECSDGGEDASGMGELTGHRDLNTIHTVVCFFLAFFLAMDLTDTRSSRHPSPSLSQVSVHSRRQTEARAALERTPLLGVRVTRLQAADTMACQRR